MGRAIELPAQAKGIAGLDDLMSLYPETMRLLATCVDLDIWERLIRYTPSTWERGGEDLRAMLRQRLALGRRCERHLDARRGARCWAGRDH